MKGGYINMNTNIISIIGIIVFILAVSIVGGIKIYQIYKRSGKKFNLKEFIDTYGDQIIAVLKDIVSFLKTSENEYSSKEEYEKAIIELTIEQIKQNYKEMGINVSILSLIDSDTLSAIVYDILHGNAIDIFSVLDGDYIVEHKRLYDEEVINAIASGII